MPDKNEHSMEFDHKHYVGDSADSRRHGRKPKLISYGSHSHADQNQAQSTKSQIPGTWTRNRGAGNRIRSATLYDEEKTLSTPSISSKHESTVGTGQALCLTPFTDARTLNNDISTGWPATDLSRKLAIIEDMPHASKELCIRCEAQIARNKEYNQDLIHKHNELESELSKYKAMYSMLSRKNSKAVMELQAHKFLNQNLISAKAKLTARNMTLTDRLAKKETTPPQFIDVAAMFEETLDELVRSLFKLPGHQVATVLELIGFQRIGRVAEQQTDQRYRVNGPATISTVMTEMDIIYGAQSLELGTIKAAESSDEEGELEDIPFKSESKAETPMNSPESANIPAEVMANSDSNLKIAEQIAQTDPQKYFLGQDKTDYVMIPLKKNGEPLDPEDLTQALTNGQIYGLNDEVKWLNGMRAESYDDTRFDMWHQHIYAVIRDADDFSAEHREQAWPWLKAMIDEAATKGCANTTWMQTVERYEDGMFVRLAEGQRH